MENNKKVLDKIKKLLALAGSNPNQNEAEAAMAKAQEIMAKFSVNPDDLEPNKIKYACKAATHSNNEGYRTILASVLAPNFRCKVIIVGNQVNFFGHEDDVDICVEIFNYAYKVSHNQGLKLERQARKNGQNTHGVANSYWKGFVIGVKTALDAQCQSLMIITPEDVHNKFKERFNGAKSYSGGMSKRIQYDEEAFHKGIAEGKAHMNSRQIEK